MGALLQATRYTCYGNASMRETVKVLLRIFCSGAINNDLNVIHQAGSGLVSPVWVWGLAKLGLWARKLALPQKSAQPVACGLWPKTLPLPHVSWNLPAGRTPRHRTH